MAPKNFLDIKTKMKVVQDIEKSAGKANYTTIGKSYNIDRRTVSRIFENRELIKRQAESGNLMRRKMCHFKEKEVDEALFKWYKTKLLQDVEVNRPLLKQKAVELAQMMGREFNPSNSWISRFTARHGIKKDRGKKQSSDEGPAHDYLASQIPDIVNQSNPRGIFNADEIGSDFKDMSGACPSFVVLGTWPFSEHPVKRAMESLCEDGTTIDAVEKGINGRGKRVAIKEGIEDIPPEPEDDRPPSCLSKEPEKRSYSSDSDGGGSVNSVPGRVPVGRFEFNPEEEVQLVEFFKSHDEFYNKGNPKYANSQFKRNVLDQMAAQLNCEASKIQGWFKNQRMQVGKLMKSVTGKEVLTSRKKWQLDNFNFLRTYIVLRSCSHNTEEPYKPEPETLAEDCDLDNPSTSSAPDSSKRRKRKGSRPMQHSPINKAIMRYLELPRDSTAIANQMQVRDLGLSAERETFWQYFGARLNRVPSEWWDNFTEDVHQILRTYTQPSSTVPAPLAATSSSHVPPQQQWPTVQQQQPRLQWPAIQQQQPRLQWQQWPAVQKQPLTVNQEPAPP